MLKKYKIKKAVSLLLSVSILFSLLCTYTYAAEPDVCFSIEGATGEVGDTVSVAVKLTKNPGIWAARFEIRFDSDELKLTDVQNGEVFSNRQFTKSSLTVEDMYIYYAELDNYNENNYNTGTIVTLTFEIQEDAGENCNVYLTFPNAGRGWFFSGENPNIDYTVPADGEVCATVSVPSQRVIRGDLTGDGKVSAADGNLIKKFITGTKATAKQAKAADLDGDNKITAIDCNMLKKLIIGKA